MGDGGKTLMPSRAYARALMNELILNTWKANRYSKEWPLHFQAVASPEKNVKAGFGRVTIRHGEAYQQTLGKPATYNHQGTVTIQVATHCAVRNASSGSSDMALVTQGDGLRESDSICESLIKAFQENPHITCVEYKNPKAREVGVDGSYFLTNVSVDFNYDEVV
jgi:hypothetical protein